MPAPIPAETVARIVELRHGGTSLTGVARQLGISRRTVATYSPPSRDLQKVHKKVRHNLLRPLSEVDEYADVIPIPFFPVDLPRLIPDPFGWSPAELRSALAHAQDKEPIMYVDASKLRLINIGQLIEVVADGITVMGKLERIKRNPATVKVTLRISGDSVCVDESQTVNIRRSPELHELHLASLGVEDLVEAGVSA